MDFNKILIIIFCQFCIIDSVLSQNLVYNPSFEYYNNCPTTVSCSSSPLEGSSYYCDDWYNASLGTSDYLHSCGGMVPSYLYGYQLPKSGNAYMAIITAYESLLFPGMTYREYIQGKLNTHLQAGHVYYGAYWVSKVDHYGNNSPDQLGAAFVEDVHYQWDDGVLMPQPVQFKSRPYYYYNDTNEWQLVDGFFTAQGGERWMIIGNLNESGDFNLENESSVWDFYATSYHLIDDVCVLDLTQTPSLMEVRFLEICTNDTQIIHTSFPGEFSYFNSLGERSDSLIITEPGTYLIYSLDANNCQLYKDSIVVEANDPIIISQLFDTFHCEGSKLVIGNDYGEGVLYNWNTGDTTPQIEVLLPGIYSVIVELGCNIFIHDTFRVETFKNDPYFNWNISDTFLCAGESILIFPISDDSNYFHYFWEDDYGPIYRNINETGTYRLTAFDLCGNSYTDSLKVEFVECSDCILLPNAFSPNGDGLNDVFRPTILCELVQYYLTIYDRWGQLVFESDNPLQEWNGLLNGKYLGNGTYYYHLRFKSNNHATPSFKKGDVTLLR